MDTTSSTESPIVREVTIGPCRSLVEVSIYVLIDPVTLKIRYVGKTQLMVHRRLCQHVSDAKRRKSKQRVGVWIRSLLRSGRNPLLKTIDVVAVGKDWAGRERRWIRRLRCRGCNLVNHCVGGWGTSGFKKSAESIEKTASALRKGKTIPCTNCGKAVYRKPKDMSKSGKQFCSKKCYQISLKGVSKPMPESARLKCSKASAAMKKAKKFCRHGHEYTVESTYINPRGARVCRTCLNQGKRNRRLKAVNNA